jgi:tetratricopeptide (TPR) repeat protein
MHSAATEEISRRQAPIIGAVFLMVATVICYLPAVRGGFVWDDDRHVSHNRTLRSLRGLKDIWLDRGATVQYYPLTHTTFWFEYRIWKLNTVGYHLTNILLHGVNAILVWALLHALGVPGAFLAASVFALHPVNVESVAWITERKNVLATFFALLSILAYLRFDVGGYLAALGSFACALFSKTIACSVPAVLVLILWWKHRLSGRQILLLLPMFALGLVLGLGTAYMERDYVGARGPEWELSFLQRLLIASRAVWFYIGKLLWPAGLAFSYPRWEIDVRDPLQYVPVVALLVVFAALIWSIPRTGRGPLVGALIYVGTLSPALGFINVYPMRYSFVADHFQYLSCIAFIALAIAGVVMAWRQWMGKQRRPALAGPAAALLLVALGALTMIQSRAYSSAESLWRDTLRKNDSSWMARNNLGAILVAQATADLQAGRRADAQPKLIEAIELLEQVQRMRPDHVKAMLSQAQAVELLSGMDQARPKYEQVIAAFRRHIERFPTDAEAHASLGHLLGMLGDYESARTAFEASLRIDPANRTALDGMQRLEAAQAVPSAVPQP